MGSLYDYLEWRGDLSISEVPLSEADYAVLCSISYIPFEGVVSAEFTGHAMAVEKAVTKVLKLAGKDGSGREFIVRETKEMLPKLLDAPRFSSIKLCGYVNKIDDEQEEQFTAVTALLPDRSLAVIYMGTDKSLIGWKEDFNLGFMDSLPSQKDAVEYLTKAAEAYPDRRIYVCGHSKGGNLAMYAGAFCRREIQDRIVRVVNLDGPGFEESILEREGYLTIRDRMERFVPQGSVVGMLLAHGERFTVIRSRATALAQHNIFSWEFVRGGFVIVDRLKDTSQLLDASLKEWVSSMTREQREKMIEAAYSVIGSSDAVTYEELLTGHNARMILKAYRNMDYESREILDTSRKLFVAAVRKAWPKKDQNKRTRDRQKR